jgi:triosephosphate isomerase
MRKHILIANWKMNLSREHSVSLAAALKEHCAESLKGTELWLAPSFLAISAIGDILGGTSIKLGAQNVHWESEGAWTGEVSASMLKELNCSFSIVGHSERRNSFHEDEQMVAMRARGAVTNGLVAVFCVGETITQREDGKIFDTLSRQLSPLRPLIKSGFGEKLLIAYEPVWAIGTGKKADASQIFEAHSFITEELSKMGLSSPLVLYGGSVKPENFSEILSIEKVAGALIGGASLEEEALCKLIEISESVQVKGL